MKRQIFLLCFFTVLISNVSYFTFTDSTSIGWLVNGSFFIAITALWSKIYKNARTREWLYIGALLLGFLFHLFVSGVDKPINEAIKWIYLVIILIAGREYGNRKIMYYGLILFFIVNCLLAIIERTTQTHLVEYSYVEGFTNSFENTLQFRSFGLMEHPLFSANVVLIILSFLLVNKKVNVYARVLLIAIGSYALICFNSRAAMIIWGGLLIYRMFLYNKKPWVPVLLGIIVYLFVISDFFALFIQENKDLFGRLTEKEGLFDESSMTRLLSYGIFAAQRWNFEDILLGGRVIYMPGTELSIENGFLLTIGWWGWIVGLTKVMVEIYISWTCLKKYPMKDKVIVLIATWVCGYANNNTINTFVFAFFILSFLALDSLDAPLYKESKNLKLEINHISNEYS